MDTLDPTEPVLPLVRGQIYIQDLTTMVVHGWHSTIIS